LFYSPVKEFCNLGCKKLDSQMILKWGSFCILNNYRYFSIFILHFLSWFPLSPSLSYLCVSSFLVGPIIISVPILWNILDTIENSNCRRTVYEFSHAVYFVINFVHVTEWCWQLMSSISESDCVLCVCFEKYTEFFF
jgi:hypothetical protein